MKLTPELLISAYVQGAFPMARSRDESPIDFYSPDPRAILPLDDFHCPQSVRQRVQSGRFEMRVDTVFEQVIRACADPRRETDETWINEEIIAAYSELHAMGLAHCVEAWRAGRLVGGLYGVAIRGVFFGESMFHDPDGGGTDASKVCLVHLVERLRVSGYALLDVQMVTPLTQRFGAIEIRREDYMQRLQQALLVETDWCA